MKNILMNVEMTKAILDGRKVQTRRPVKDVSIIDAFLKNGSELNKLMVIDRLAKYQKGQTIWVREPAVIAEYDMRYDCLYNEIYNARYMYLADREFGNIEIIKSKRTAKKWLTNCQGIPNGCIKEMARIFLKITNVRVAKLRDMSTIDKIEEGYPKCSADDWLSGDRNGATAEDIYNWFGELWNKTAPKGYKWEDNPYVFVYEFERVENV